MKYQVFTLLFILLHLELFSTNIDDLKKTANRTNSPHDWNKVAAYYSENEHDTTQLKMAAEKAYQLSVSQKDFVEMGIALYHFSFLEYERHNMSKFHQRLRHSLDCFLKAQDIDKIILIMNKIGYYFLETGKVDSAIITYKQLINTVEKMDSTAINASFYLNIANAYYLQTLLDSSIYYAQMALEIGTREKDSAILINAYNKLGLYAKTLHDYTKALQNYEKALLLCQTTKKDEELYYIYFNMSALYNEWGKAELGLEFAEKALNYAKKISNKRTYAQSLIQYGSLLISNCHYLQGIDSVKKGLSHEGEISTETFYAFLRLAHAYQELSEPDSSRFYLQKVEKELENLPEGLKGDYFLQKSLLAFFEKKYDAVIFYSEQYLRQMTNPETLRTTINKDIYNKLSESYEIGRHDYGKALYYKKIAYSMQDTIYQQKQKELVNEFDIRYQIAEKELEKTQSINNQIKITLQRTRIIAAFGIIGVVIVLIWLYILLQRLRKKSKI